MEDKTVEAVKEVSKQAVNSILGHAIHAAGVAIEEAAVVGGGAVGGFLAAWFRGRGNEQKAQAFDQARQLYSEGKHDEARELIIKSHIFGHGAQIGMLAAIAYMVQFFLDAGEENKIGPFLDALDELEADTKDRLEHSLGVIDSVEERGKLLVKLARTPGDLKVRIHQQCRISRIELDPNDNPVKVFVDEVGGAFSAATNCYGAKVDAKMAEIRARQAARTGTRGTRR